MMAGVNNLRSITVDCRHPASLARFWAAVLDGYDVAPYDEAELARLRANGIFDVEDDPTVLVEPVDATEPRLLFQLVPEPKLIRNSIRFDLRTDEPARAMRRLIQLGARVLAEHDGSTVMAD